MYKLYVIVIVRLVCDMAQTQHEARGCNDFVHIYVDVDVFMCANIYIYTYTKYLAHCQSSILIQIL